MSASSDALPTAPAPPDRTRPRCPRCGAVLGRLAVDEPDAGLYCGCCGVVVPGPTPASAGAGGR